MGPPQFAARNGRPSASQMRFVSPATLMELFYEHSNTCFSATSCSRFAASRRYAGFAFHHPRGDTAPWLLRGQHDRASKIVRAFATRRTPFVISFSFPANSAQLL